jgi:hypothetical protein
MAYEERLQGEYGRLLREASAHLAGKGGVYQTLLNLARRLDEEGISYAVIGGMALGKHGYARMTEDVDVLMTVEGLAAFQSRCVGKGYVPAFAGSRKRFRDTETQVRIEIITTGEYPGDGKPKSVVFPDPGETSVEVEGVRVVTLDKLIELKLASGMSAPHRLRDLADVQDLIGVLELSADFAERLDESVRDQYAQLWQAVHSVQVNKTNEAISDTQ